MSLEHHHVVLVGAEEGKGLKESVSSGLFSLLVSDMFDLFSNPKANMGGFCYHFSTILQMFPKSMNLYKGKEGIKPCGRRKCCLIGSYH